MKGNNHVTPGKALLEPKLAKLPLCKSFNVTPDACAATAIVYCAVDSR